MNTTTPSAQELNPALIFDTLNAYQKSAALKASIELDLFTAIARGSRKPEEIAKAVGASVRGTRILCDFLTLNGFLRKESDAYFLTVTSEMFLNRNSPAYFG